jgi:adenine-specific DNA-methyltransferase
VFLFNSNTNQKLKFLCIQLPEPTFKINENGERKETEASKAGFKTISDIGMERIRLAGSKILKEKTSELKEMKEYIKGKLLQEEIERRIKKLENTIEQLDFGYRAFRLDTSNILAWDGSVENLEENLLSAVENIKPDRTEEDVLFEILLKYGVDLAQPIEEKEVAGCKVFSIGAGVLFVCLSDKITTAVADGIGAWKNELNPAVSKVVFKDSGFAGDVDKTNAIQILKRFGITDVKSI